MTGEVPPNSAKQRLLGLFLERTFSTAQRRLISVHSGRSAEPVLGSEVDFLQSWPVTSGTLVVWGLNDRLTPRGSPCGVVEQWSDS
jgi:hypothetical protein